MFKQNNLIQGTYANFDRERKNKRIKSFSKILLFTMICGDAIFLTGFTALHLYNKFVESNQIIYPTAVKDNQEISPTAIPWIKTKEQCLKTDRVWQDGECLDSEWSHLF